MIEYIKRTAAGNDLTIDEAHDAVEAAMDGRASAAQVAALLVALAAKGESAEEIAGAARAVRRHAVAVVSTRRPIVDVCGTGGDSAGTFNISTAAAVVVAGAGVAVAKHGNRAMSSRCGSADLLERLGVRIDASKSSAEAALNEEGIAFLFAQAYHPSMRQVAPIRREIGIRTLFNVIGPLSNPAHAHRQIVGVARAPLLELVAGALGRLGSERAAAVFGDGIDEIGLSGETQVAEWTGERVVRFSIDPQDFGFERAPAAAIAGGDPAQNAAIIHSILDGSPGAPRDVVLLNAGFALQIAGAAPGLPDGVVMAARSIDTGAARAKLDALVRRTNP